MSFVLFLLLQTAVPAAPPATDADIVVIGSRLKGWAGKISDTIGITSCRTTKSTGDRDIDRIGCRAMTDCFPAFKSKMVAVTKAAGRDPEQRRAAMAPVNAELTTCVKARREVLIADLAAQRRNARP